MNFFDLIFPKDIYCISCGRPLPVQSSPSGNEGLAICERCDGEIEWISGRCCEKCGRQLADENHKSLCRECSSGPEHIYRKGVACALYSGRAADMVRDMKYRGRAWLADTVAELMALRYLSEADALTGELPSYDYIVPAPMNAKKKARRGYDQAALLSEGLGRRIGIPHLGDAVRRTRNTETMSGLSGDERRQNLAGAFAVHCDIMEMIRGKSVLLVDDVYTTGSTVNACAEVLLDAGAAAVDVMVFAIGADAAKRSE